MTNEIPSFDFNAQVAAFHKNAKNKGFYDDYPTLESRDNGEYRVSRANLIAGELYEGYEAYRKGKINADEAVISQLCGVMGEHGKDIFNSTYEREVKGTLAEELADAYIRLCDTYGSFHLPPVLNDFYPQVADWAQDILRLHPTPQLLFWRVLNTIGAGIYYRVPPQSHFEMWIGSVYALAIRFEIDLQLHIRLKSFYNLYRGYKHGKDF